MQWLLTIPWPLLALTSVKRVIDLCSLGPPQVTNSTWPPEQCPAEARTHTLYPKSIGSSLRFRLVHLDAFHPPSHREKNTHHNYALCLPSMLCETNRCTTTHSSSLSVMLSEGLDEGISQASVKEIVVGTLPLVYVLGASRFLLRSLFELLTYELFSVSLHVHCYVINRLWCLWFTGLYPNIYTQLDLLLN